MATAYRSPFAGPEIDFGRIADIADSYYGAKDAAIKRQALQEDRQFLQGERARAAQERQALTGVMSDPSVFADGKFNAQAAADKLLRLGLLDKAQSVYGPESARGKLDLDAAHAELYRAQGAKARAEPNAKYSLSPVYGTDEAGKPVLLQPSNTGEAIRTKIPDGITISTGVEKVDLGTEWGLLDKRSGQIIRTMPKDIAGAAREKEVGEAQGKAQVGLPGALGKAQTVLDTIEQVRNHPGRKFGTGWSGYLPDVAPQQRDFAALVKQLGGQAFLSAFQELKGGGHITEIEGQKATEAIARLDRAQSEAGFLAALDDLQGIIAAGAQRARAAAGPAGRGAANPPPGATQRKTLNGKSYVKINGQWFEE